VKKLGENYPRFFTIKKDEERKGKEGKERERKTIIYEGLGVVTCHEGQTTLDN
jgi:hypothetical protein